MMLTKLLSASALAAATLLAQKPLARKAPGWR